MSVFSRLFKRGDSDALDAQAESLVGAAQLQAAGMYVPLVEDFPVLAEANYEQWKFIATTACVFIAATRLSNSRLESGRARHLMEIVARKLHEWDPSDGIRAFEDCKRVFEQEHDHLSSIEHDPQFIASDAVGIWIFLNAFGKPPVTTEEVGLVRAAGTLATHAFFNWWQ